MPTDLTRRTPDLAAGVLQLPNVAQYIAQKLEEMILNGELQPGQTLAQIEIAARFGVSRFPVRDAFKILESKELLVNTGRAKLTRVRPIDLREVRDLFELRLMLEPRALVDSAARLGPSELDRAEQLLVEQEAMPMEHFLRLQQIDEEFHRVLLSRCMNIELLKILAGIWSRIRILRAMSRDNESWNEGSVRQHREILAALRRGDLAGAGILLETGIRTAQQGTWTRLELKQGRNSA